MKVFLIDPFDETVEEVEYKGTAEDITRLIQNDNDPFDLVRLPSRDCIYVDDNGLLKSGQSFFLLNCYPQPLAGRALVVGDDGKGDDAEPKITLDALRAMVSFDPLEILMAIRRS